MIYRIATLKDFEKIILMKNRVKERIIKSQLPIWLNGYPMDCLIEEDIKNKEARVIELDGKIIAYSMLCETSKEYDEENIFDTTNLYSFGRVMVDDGYTGLGVGKFLISNLINEVKSLNKKGMKITADSCNIKALNLYKSFGFKKEGEHQFPYAYLEIYGLYF